MTVFNAEEVKKCLEDVVGEDKEYALWLLEWVINKRSYDLEEYRKQIKAEAFDEFIDKFIKRTLLRQMTKAECINTMYVLAEELKEQDK